MRRLPSAKGAFRIMSEALHRAQGLVGQPLELVEQVVEELGRGQSGVKIYKLGARIHRACKRFGLADWCCLAPSP